MIYKTLHRKLMIEQHKAKHIYNALRLRFQTIMYDIFTLKEQSSWSTRFVIIQILAYIAVSLPFYFIPSCYNWKKFSVYYYYYYICSARYNTFRKKQKRQSTFVFFSDRSKNPDKSLLLSVLPAIAKKSYIDVGTTPCVSTNIGKIIRIACMIFVILFIILVWLGCSYFYL